MQNTTFSKAESAAFTGHRSVPFAQRELIGGRLDETINQMHEKGIRNFYCGMAVGFDLMAAEAVMRMKKILPDIRFIAVVPFRGQDERFRPWDKTKYHQLLVKADEVIVLSDYYFTGCLLRRNDFMLDQSSFLIAYYNGEQKGGTFYTCRRAERMKIPVLNIF